MVWDLAFPSSQEDPLMPSYKPKQVADRSPGGHGHHHLSLTAYHVLSPEASPRGSAISFHHPNSPGLVPFCTQGS